MEITITVAEHDYLRIMALGRQPWASMTLAKRKEYDEICSLLGSSVCIEIVQKYSNRD